MNGFTSTNWIGEVTLWDADTNATVMTTYVEWGPRIITQITDTAQSSLNATNITVNGLLQWESTPTVTSPARHYYDALGRETQVVSPLGFSSTVTYNSAGQVASVLDYTGLLTDFDYYGQGSPGAGRVRRTGVGGKNTYRSYTQRGELFRTWGDVPYPEERIYSTWGEMQQLNTFRGGSAWAGTAWPTNTTGTADTNRWIYQEHSGLLTNQTDALGQSVWFTYTNGLLLTKALARGLVVTNSYNKVLELVTTSYADPSLLVAYSDFSRQGLPRKVQDQTGIWRMEYDHAGRVTASVCTNGIFSGITISNRFNGLNGRDQLKVLGVSPTITQSYVYDSYGRMSTVSDGVYTANYGYLTDSDLLQTSTFKNNGTTKLTTTRSWDFGSRLGSIANTTNGVAVTSHSYIYDGLNRRTHARLEDGSLWMYGYNDRNELLRGHRYWEDFSPVSGQRYEYTYDTIGNRVTASSGGDTSGMNLRTRTNSVNAANQYTSITTPGYEDIVGAAWGTSIVTVNNGAGGGTADRKGEYFHREITIANSSTSVWQNVAIVSGGTSSNGGFVFPKSIQSPAYDLDGNMVSADEIWGYGWDAENRLINPVMQSTISVVPNTNRVALNLSYDRFGHRAVKFVSAWSGSTFTNVSYSRFISDGGRIVAEINGSGSVLRSYLWGQDLSGTLDNAGGIGGLVLVHDHSGGTYHFPAYDGNGNVTALVNASDQSLSARYEYSPFGELIRATGPLARSNPFRWSTKYWDEETGLVDYGRRVYRPDWGRFLSKDPIGQSGGVNLYAFVGNSPIDFVDDIGTAKVKYGGGHHVIPGEIIELLDEGPVADLFNKWKVPADSKTPGAPHRGFSTAHSDYNEAVMARFKDFLARHGMDDVKDFSQNPQLAQMLINEVFEDTKTGGFLRSIRPAASVLQKGRGALKAGIVLAGAAAVATAKGAPFIGQAITLSRTPQIANQLSQDMANYSLAAAKGDDAWITLEAVNTTITLQNVEGDYFTSMWALGLLLQ